MMATVRNRRGIITNLHPFDGKSDGILHLVTISYTDSDGVQEDQVIWEREPNATCVLPLALPAVEKSPPMLAHEYDALLRATRWGALTPFLAPEDPSKKGAEPISAPFHGAVQVEDFQLVPMLKALRMPRVSLLLADDVGLGKTIEAGLILNELLIRRRIRRVLILCPASLRDQWQQEMDEKFALSFDVIDRDETINLKKRLGMDANPWRVFPRAIASYHYLRQPNVMEEFRAATESNDPTQPSHMPWDLLIVDEAHNLMPANYGEDSDLANMLRIISPWFEHKLFLTATPHNGHTRCFTGLLEQLDPSRFHRTSDLHDKRNQGMKKRISEVVVRRLKSDINNLDLENNRPPRFADRELKSNDVNFGPGELQLFRAFESFRLALLRELPKNDMKELLAGRFSLEVLNKRLLSGPTTFADSWFRFRHGMDGSPEKDVQSANQSDVANAKRAVDREIDDDVEHERVQRFAAETTGEWFKQYYHKLKSEIETLDRSLATLGLKPVESGIVQVPTEDARFDILANFIEDRLRQDKGWRSDERLIIFTEYMTSLNYLSHRLRTRFKDHTRFHIRELFGGMQRAEREEIKLIFNDPDSGARILIATDAASEGLNLQESARLLFHWDIPWNPARLEQRNGRLDRHGQARTVEVNHFDSSAADDLKFMARVITKVHTIRNDLQTMGEVFERAFEEKFSSLTESKNALPNLDRRTAHVQKTSEAKLDLGETKSQDDVLLEEAARIGEFQDHIDLTPDSLKSTLEAALGIGTGLPRLSSSDGGRYSLNHPIPPHWNYLIDSTLRKGIADRAQSGALPRLAFDSGTMTEQVGERRVFRHRKDTVLMHLGHPLFKQTLAQFARARFPNAGVVKGEYSTTLDASRWIVRTGGVPNGMDALLLFTVEELAINKLREPLHHWVRTIEIPIKDGQLQTPMPYRPPTEVPTGESATPVQLEIARDIWTDIALDCMEFVKSLKGARSEQIKSLLKEHRPAVIKAEKQRYTERINEIKSESQSKNVDKLKADLEKETAQQALDSDSKQRRMEKIRSLEDEIKLRESHYAQLLESVKKQEEEFLKHILPNRLELDGEISIFPVAVEIRL
ncbi:DNA helicase [Microvenator marinus]|uniref:DNA helicase n=2 Tax=Microvenator marinus TaxID=2600177 RepID=A0A5B8XYZ8_9DELT|nr:DNA helicase [Microvenator marinus]